MQRNNKTETKLFSLNVRADRLVKQMDLELQRAKATDNWTRYDKLQDELDDANSLVKEVETTLDAPSPEKPKAVSPSARVSAPTGRGRGVRNPSGRGCGGRSPAGHGRGGRSPGSASLHVAIRNEEDEAWAAYERIHGKDHINNQGLIR